jgi:HlyD family secretion protein
MTNPSDRPTGPVADIASLVAIQARRPWRLAAGGVVILLVLVAVGWWWYASTRPKTVAVPVQTVEVTRGPIASVLSTSGSASAVLQTKLTFNASGSTTVTGVVASVDVKVGDRVTRGQRLATLDSRNVQRTLQQATARVASERIKLDQLALTVPQNVAAAAQTVAATQAALQKSLNDLATLQQSPTYAQDLAVARQNTLTAQNALSTAQQALDALLGRSEAATQAEATQRRLDELNAQRIAAERELEQFAEANPDSLLRSARLTLVRATTALCSRAANLAGCRDGALAATDFSSLVNALSSITGGADVGTSAATFVQTTGTSEGLRAAEFRELQAVAAIPGLQDRINSLVLSLSGAAGAPSADTLNSARAARDAAAAGLAAARAKLDTVVNGATAANIQDAQNAVASARAAADTALAKQAAIGGQDNSNYALQQQQVLLAEIGLQQAQDAVDDGTLKAPFAGVVGAVAINPGDLVAPSTVAITLTDPDRIAVQLTVSEADLPGLGSGQFGTATFDALPGRTYIVRTTGVSNIPTVTQGVVTYQAQAEILTGDTLRAESTRLLDVLRTRGQIPAKATQAEANAFVEAAAKQTLPAPGMNANVAIVEQIVQDALLVPSGSIRKRGADSVVTLLKADGTQEPVKVTLGVTDGVSTAITSGVKAGDRVVTSGLTSTATAAAGGGVFGPGGVR